MSETQTEVVQPAWCIAANIVAERHYGPGGHKTRRGIKQLAPGAKVYLVEFFWGMGGEAVTVVGRQRRSHRYITITIRSAWLVNWRVELVYSAYVVRALQSRPATYWPHQASVDSTDFSWMGSVEAQAKAELILDSLKQWHPTATQTQAFTTRGSTQPGTEE